MFLFYFTFVPLNIQNSVESQHVFMASESRHPNNIRKTWKHGVGKQLPWGPSGEPSMWRVLNSEESFVLSYLISMQLKAMYQSEYLLHLTVR